MKNTVGHAGRGFSLIELVVVVGIVAILAAMLLPTSGGKRAARVALAQLEVRQIVDAIHQYESVYGHLPVSSNAMSAASVQKEDLTFGGPIKTPTGSLDVAVPGLSYQANNSEIMAVLLGRTNYPSTGLPMVNAGGVNNTQHIGFLKSKMVGVTNLWGIGPDLVWRDPWRNPYIITLDLNNDQKTRDAFYRRQKVSQTRRGRPGGYFGLINARDSDGNGDHFEGNTRVMVWSAGPDGMIDPEARANGGANKDNILSWKQ